MRNDSGLMCPCLVTATTNTGVKLVLQFPEIDPAQAIDGELTVSAVIVDVLEPPAARAEFLRLRALQ